MNRFSSLLKQNQPAGTCRRLRERLPSLAGRTSLTVGQV